MDAVTTSPVRLFVSYRFAEERFVRRLAYHLAKQPSVEPYCYADARQQDSWIDDVGRHLADCGGFLFLCGDGIGDTQRREANIAIGRKPPLRRQVVLLDGAELPEELTLLYGDAPPIRVSGSDEHDFLDLAQRIVEFCGGRWLIPDGLPTGYLFSDEKEILRAFVADEIDGDRLEQGCPPEWPRVPFLAGRLDNPIRPGEIGLFRDEPDGGPSVEPEVLAGCLTSLDLDRLSDLRLTFPEAGPRKLVRYPRRGQGLNAGILVSGGIAPGINAVVASIVDRHHLYAIRGGYAPQLGLVGYRNGFNGLIQQGNHRVNLTRERAHREANLGGSMLGTSRAAAFLDADPYRVEGALRDAVRRLSQDGVGILYVIGGDGSMRAAHSLWRMAQELGEDISIAAVPKTMDNDILWVWQSFGFLSAVERAKGAIQQLHTEVTSNPRLCVIQLFGSDSGFVVSHAVLASGECDLLLIPEVPFSLATIGDYIRGVLFERYTKPPENRRVYGMVVMAETAVPNDAAKYLDDPELGLTADEKAAIRAHLRSRRVLGQTPDGLRSGTLKLVSRYLLRAVRDQLGDFWKDFRVVTNEPRHLIRSIPPSSSDIIFAQRLGALAVDGAMAGFTDFMVSQWLTEYVLVPLPLVVLGRKRIPEKGMFLKSVRAATDQPADLR